MSIPSDKASKPTTSSVDPVAPKPDWLKRVPSSRDARQRIRQRAIETAMTLDKARPLDKHELEARSRLILEELDEPENSLGWTMVTLASAFWQDQVAATPYDRRLLLLPHCLRNVESCPAHYNELGLLCQGCGACGLHDLTDRARRLGYHVLVAEGSPVVMRIILEGHADALVGVSCLDVLERSFEKILLAGIPCMAVPLLDNTCKNSETDVDWVKEMIDTPYRSVSARTQTYVHLLRSAKRMFQPEELQWLAPRVRGGRLPAQTGDSSTTALDPLASTEAIAYDFLLAGGKRARPFVTLAAYDAMTGSAATQADGAEAATRVPESVRRVALAMEVFHKASLVHDDIEDDDPCRYGHEALHRRYGTATAINVGDYLIGLGYRLVADQRSQLEAPIVADVLAQLAEAHTRLSEGQGAELAWRTTSREQLVPREALKIYALKTAPAFEAALYAGIRLAGQARHYRQPIARYSRHLGVAYQILNDLNNWRPKDDTQPTTGGDLLAGRPTVLLALALESLDENDRQKLLSLANHPESEDRVIQQVDRLYQQTGVYEKARTLIEKHHGRALEVADNLQPDALRQLLHYLADSLLE